ncbi:MAG: hypothetical protein R2681_05125 [Pyrinomonadaceae bacterium]
MAKNNSKITRQKALERIEKGRRSKWWRRKGTPKSGFTYCDKDGKKIAAKADLQRIEDLVIPPAWKYVRISPSPRGKLQAAGIDEAGRVQYLYSEAFRRKREREKFKKIEDFGGFLPKLLEKTNRDMHLDGFPKDKILALVIRLINSLYIRIGSDDSVKKFRTYGITTLKKDHLKIGHDGTLTFDFVGKHRVRQRKVMVDEELADLLRKVRKIGNNKKLFVYLDEEGDAHAVKPADINKYIKDSTSTEFSSKDFRTWGATLLAALELSESGCCEDEKAAKKNIVAAVKNVAEELGNTPSVCRGSYIHPSVIKAYEEGITLEEFTPKKSRRIKRIAGHKPEEKALIKMLRRK